MEEINVTYALGDIDDKAPSSIFLAGPTPRDERIPSWRPVALYHFAEFGYKGQIFVPEPPTGLSWDWKYYDQVEWEAKCLEAVTCIMFWIPRELDTMPGFTTNVEFGYWCRSGKIVVGHPYGADKIRYIDHYIRKLAIRNSENLKDTVRHAVEMAEARGKK